MNKQKNQYKLQCRLYCTVYFIEYLWWNDQASVWHQYIGTEAYKCADMSCAYIRDLQWLILDRNHINTLDIGKNKFLL